MVRDGAGHRPGQVTLALTLAAIRRSLGSSPRQHAIGGQTERFAAPWGPCGITPTSNVFRPKPATGRRIKTPRQEVSTDAASLWLSSKPSAQSLDGMVCICNLAMKKPATWRGAGCGVSPMPLARTRTSQRHRTLLVVSASERMRL